VNFDTSVPRPHRPLRFFPSMEWFGRLRNLEPRAITRRTPANGFSQAQRNDDASGSGNVACSNLSRAGEG